MKNTYPAVVRITLLTAILLCSGFIPISQAQLMLPDVHPKFINPLPDPAVIDATNGGSYNMEMRSTVQWLGLVDVNGLPLNTTVWGYGPVNNITYPGPTFWAMKGKPINVTWKNNLPNTHLLPIDMSIHIAHPMNWVGKGIPTVAHLHGGHTESASDGLPDAWFTSGYKYTGPDFIKKKYYYSNDQEAATLWYHDHALGITRLNVYAGLAGFYLLRDANEMSLNLPSGIYEREIVFQDRNFDANGQLVLPAAGVNQGDCNDGIPDNPLLPNAPLTPGAPSIEAEFFGEYIIVNGMAWPKLDVEPRQYRFRLLNGSDSRFYYFEFKYGENMTLPFLQIGTDNGLLPNPVPMNNLLLAPGERADVLVDFSPADGNSVMLFNYGPDEPFGTLGDLNYSTDRPTAQIMRFDVIVSKNTNVQFPVFNSSSLLRGEILPYSPTKTRKLVLFEGRDQYCRLRPQLGILDENNVLNGSLMWDEPITELPDLGAVEYWEIYNTTMDAHPIHLHQVAFQIFERTTFNGTVTFDPNGDPIAGGTKQILSLNEPATFSGNWEAEPHEKGWKDTGVIPPDGVMRVAAKFDLPGKYVWHCHILSHEDHEMMRPFFVGKSPGVVNRDNFLPATDSDAGNPSFELLQAYPNPVRDNTEIIYNIPVEMSVTLSVTDMQGRMVRILANGLHEAGMYRQNWDGRDHSGRLLPPGVYNYTMQSDTKIQTRRLVIAD